MGRSNHKGMSGYASEAAALLTQYEALDPGIVHDPVRSFFLDTNTSLIDIGCGTGRDAAWFAKQGYAVTAVEPTKELREGAQKLHATHNIDWIDDQLPKLATVLALRKSWHMVMLTAVWMHLSHKDRVVGMERLSQLTQPGSRVFISLRHGEVPAGRIMFDVSGEETTTLATRYGFRTLFCETRDSAHIDFRDNDIRWTNVVLERTT